MSADQRAAPCPFCGGAARVVTRDVEPQNDPWYGKNMQTFVECTACGCCRFDIVFHDGFGDEESAIAAWNRRTPAIAPAAHALVQEALPRSLPIREVDGESYVRVEDIAPVLAALKRRAALTREAASGEKEKNDE